MTSVEVPSAGPSQPPNSPAGRVKHAVSLRFATLVVLADVLLLLVGFATGLSPIADQDLGDLIILLIFLGLFPVFSLVSAGVALVSAVRNRDLQALFEVLVASSLLGYSLWSLARLP